VGPLARFQVPRYGLGEIDHDSQDRPVDRRRDDHIAHDTGFGADDHIIKKAALKSPVDQAGEPSRQAADVACRYQHREK